MDKVAIDLIVQHISLKLQKRGQDLRETFLQRKEDSVMPETLILLPETNQIRVIIIFIKTNFILKLYVSLFIQN